MKIFKYKLARRLSEIAIPLLLLLVAIQLFDPVGAHLKVVGTTLLVLLVLTIATTSRHMLNQQYEIEGNQLKIAKKIGQDSVIHFDDLRRIVVQELPAYSLARRIIFFAEIETDRIDIAGLDDEYGFIQALKQKAEEYGFTYLHLDQNGGVVERIKT